jgi:lysozyme
MANPVICVDVDLSEHQTEFNFQSFKDGGSLGVILKASEGESLKDVKHPVFKEQALAAGLAVASYHYLRPGT